MSQQDLYETLFTAEYGESNVYVSVKTIEGALVKPKTLDWRTGSTAQHREHFKPGRKKDWKGNQRDRNIEKEREGQG